MMNTTQMSFANTKARFCFETKKLRQLKVCFEYCQNQKLENVLENGLETDNGSVSLHSDLHANVDL